jgi:hypothetical protein
MRRFLYYFKLKFKVCRQEQLTTSTSLQDLFRLYDIF